jgi:hypothetical protein
LGAVAESYPCPKTGRRGPPPQDKGSSLGVNNDAASFVICGCGEDLALRG